MGRSAFLRAWHGQRDSMLTQAEKGRAFHALHERDRAFIIPNPWDVGTTRLLERLGFEALATTSAGYAFSVGRRDGTIDRDETMAHVATIASATDLPVSRRSRKWFWRHARERRGDYPAGRGGRAGGRFD